MEVFLILFETGHCQVGISVSTLEFGLRSSQENFFVNLMKRKDLN